MSNVEFSLPQAHRVVEVAAPGQRVLAVTPASFSFTNYLDAASWRASIRRARAGR